MKSLKLLGLLVIGIVACGIGCAQPDQPISNEETNSSTQLAQNMEDQPISNPAQTKPEKLDTTTFRCWLLLVCRSGVC